MKYTPNSPAVVEEMLRSAGFNNLDELFNDIPEAIKQKQELELGAGKGEMEISRELKGLAGKNITAEDYPCFLGAGAYDHYIPAVVDQILSRSEFYTAYTPYQPEISQGILQSIFEYQTMICMLTGMEVANASMYDGASALAEACALACANAKGDKILVSDTINPEYMQVLKTYAISGRMQIVPVASADGVCDQEQMAAQIGKDTAAVVIQQPNFFGNLEQIENMAEAVHQQKGFLIMAVDPISLAILKTPAAQGADIVVGEGQALGNSLSFGGPYLGFFAAGKKFLRKIPGRIVGQTTDLDGKRAFVLTLQAREQHIRREKANSNICSNQALNALAAAVYMTTVGSAGLSAIATRCHQLAQYAARELQQAGLQLKYRQPFFREFAVLMDDPAAANRRLLEHGIIGGYELEDAMLLAFTEKRSKAEIDKLVAVLGGKA